MEERKHSKVFLTSALALKEADWHRRQTTRTNGLSTQFETWMSNNGPAFRRTRCCRCEVSGGGRFATRLPTFQFTNGMMKLLDGDVPRLAPMMIRKGGCGGGGCLLVLLFLARTFNLARGEPEKISKLSQ